MESFDIGGDDAKESNETVYHVHRWLLYHADLSTPLEKLPKIESGFYLRHSPVHIAFTFEYGRLADMERGAHRESGGEGLVD